MSNNYLSTIMNQSKRWITPGLERKAFEEIISSTFNKYKDNLMCSDSILEEIIKKTTNEIREQLQGVSRGEK
jgi:hypothetical protein